MPKETFGLAAENLGELLTVLDDMTISMDNVLRQHGKDMLPTGLTYRWALVRQSRALLDKIYGEEPAVDLEDV